MQTLEHSLSSPPLLRPAARRAQPLARFALAGQILFVASCFVAALAQRRYSQLDQTISELAADDAQQAWIMMGGFVIFGLSLIALAGALRRSVASGTRVAAATLIVAGALMPVAALARLDCQTSSQLCRDKVAAENVSSHDDLHNLASLGIFVSLAVAPLVWARRFKRDRRWAKLRRPSIAAGIATFVLLALDVVVVDGSRHWAGLTQRGLLGVIVGWVCLVGWHVLRMPARAQE